MHITGSLALFQNFLGFLITTFHGTDVMGIVGNDGSYTFMGRVLNVVSILTSLISNSCICVSKRISSRLPSL